MIKKAINKFNRLFFKFTPKIENNSNNIIHIELNTVDTISVMKIYLIQQLLVVDWERRQF